MREAVPTEMTHVRELTEAGVLKELYVSSPGRAWLVIEAAGRQDAEDLVEQFPMRPYVETTIDELMG